MFNMNPTSLYFKNELNGSNTVKLVDELNEQIMKTNIDFSDVKKFISSLKHHLEVIESNLDAWYLDDKNNNSRSSKEYFIPPVTARQHTPHQLSTIAKKYNFKEISLYGFHPHIMQPLVGKILSLRVFNEISNALCVFESDPISLTWCSGFIAKFLKEGD